jgi:putative NADH-flavin reductase
MNSRASAIIALIGLAALPAAEVFADRMVVYGASGRVGGIIVDEALMRGHDVFGISRNPDGLDNDHENFTALEGDVTVLDSMLSVIEQADPDVVIFAVRAIGPENTPDVAVTSIAARTYLEAAAILGDDAPRVIQISGGGTLWDKGVWLLEDPSLVPGTARHANMFGHWQAIETYKAAQGITWTVMTPPTGTMSSGERTGAYRLGLENMLYDRNDSSAISTQDFAVAVIDEAETSVASGKRVTVGPIY